MGRLMGEYELAMERALSWVVAYRLLGLRLWWCLVWLLRVENRCLACCVRFEGERSSFLDLLARFAHFGMLLRLVAIRVQVVHLGRLVWKMSGHPQSGRECLVVVLAQMSSVHEHWRLV